MNAIALPSGDQRGMYSALSVAVNRLMLPLSTRSANTSGL